eukprot:scaffold299554_cov18-Tisochrysis_lutea.AAC.1
MDPSARTLTHPCQASPTATRAGHLKVQVVWAFKTTRLVLMPPCLICAGAMAVLHRRGPQCEPDTYERWAMSAGIRALGYERWTVSAGL